MSIIRGLRFPTALAFGLLFTASIFWSLWSFTNVTFQLGAIKPTKIEFSRTLVDTPVETKNPVEQIQAPPGVQIIPTGPTIDGRTVDIVPVLITPPIDARNTGPNQIPVSQDRDVIPLVRVSPTYPPRALAREIEGWVQVQFTITGTGTVKDVIVVESSPPNVFDAAAVEAVSRWRYNPKVEGAVAVDRVGVQTLLRFDLEEE
jgi:periplasmic protein TonB